jgi:hypothetical protein
LAAVLSKRYLHGILLSKMTPSFPSFPFIDLYVLALTPWLQCSKAALQFVENT